MTIWIQKEICLEKRKRGYHLITDELLEKLPEIKDFSIGTMQLFLKHTSASLSINENADPTVRKDFERFFNQLAPENEAYYEHTFEGPDDLPAHFKSSILGCSIALPIFSGRLNLGTWQGIYLGEHRNEGGQRKIVVTLSGKS